MIYTTINRLVAYGLQTQLIQKEDIIYTVNCYLEALNIQDYEGDSKEIEIMAREEINLSEVLEELMVFAYEKGILEGNSTAYKDLFDTKLMSILVPKPSEVIRLFKEKYKRCPQEATDYYYQFSQDTNYIRRDRIAKDKKWKVQTPYGTLDITINLSKPEKDPKAIMAAKTMKQSGYPKCLLCAENEGYAGRVNHPARQNHRIIPISIQGGQWGMQYSPYVYYHEHCIVFNGQHVPMQINKDTFIKLFDFVKLFPHYFVGSNADLPIVGGSILSHDHFQGGAYEFAMAKAPVEGTYQIPGFEEVEVGRVKWPMSVLRLRGTDEKRIIDLAGHILEKWRSYTDEAAFIFAYTQGEPHNTLTPIARKVGEYYELDLVLRNNLTTEERPHGVYHPNESLHHIKKENIGLIEVMGLAVLPSRLLEEMDLVKDYILQGKEVRTNPDIEKHGDWVDFLKRKYINLDAEHIQGIIEEEIGWVFMKVLEDAGVYKYTEQGIQNFERFIHCL